MIMVSKGSYTQSENSVKKLIRWLNEIHVWGSGSRGSEVEINVKIILATTPGASRTSLSEAELQQLFKVKT